MKMQGIYSLSYAGCYVQLLWPEPFRYLTPMSISSSLPGFSAVYLLEPEIYMPVLSQE